MSQRTGPPTVEQMRFVQEIYERHRGLIYHIAMGRAREPIEADEIVSEALERMFRYADTMMTLREKQLVDYVADTVRSVAADFGRRHKKEARRFVSYDDGENVPESTAADPETAMLERESESERLRMLYAALDELPHADRRLLLGKYIDGESDEELARQLGVKASSIRMKLTRARNRARRLMERKGVDDSE